MSVADLELSYILTLHTFPWYTKQTEKYRVAFQHLCFLYIQHQVNNFSLLLAEHWQAVEISYIRLYGLYYTRQCFISANLLGWQKPTEFSTFHQSCQQFPGFGRPTNKILLVKAETLSLGPVAASLPHTENRSQLSTSDHCLKGHLKAYIQRNFYSQNI